MRKIRIFDTTLRDGEQTLGVSLSPEQKLDIAKRLDALGVDVIEAGFPVVSEGESRAISMIISEGLTCEIAGLARTSKKDIDAAAKAGLDYVHTFIATSDLHLQYKLRMSREQALAKAVESTEYAKSHGMQVEFSAEDATRTDREFLKDVFKAVTKAGADRIDIPDTVGYATPEYIAKITKDAIEASGLPISIHCHNDFGLAVANALSGIHAGASCAHVTINGIGERAGNAALEEVSMALQCLSHDAQEYSTNIKSQMIYETSQYISNKVGIQVQPNKAIVGDNAFGHESGIHTHGMLSHPLTYEPISPELVGRKRLLRVGKHAGIHGMNAVLDGYGVHPTEEQSRKILERIKDLGDKGKQITDAELLSITGDIIGNKVGEGFVTLTGFSVSTGTGTMPYAFVRLNIDGKDLAGTDYGVGPVDASLKAIQRIVGKVYDVRITDYGLASISGGSDALCEVTISVEDTNGSVVTAKSTGEDIVITSVKAVINGINGIMLKKNNSRK